jgi:DNA-binding NtrC family response regulator
MSRLDVVPKTRQARPDVPVIVITAYGDAETCRKSVERGAADLFTKPIDFPELRFEIDRLAPSTAFRWTPTVHDTGYPRLSAAAIL